MLELFLFAALHAPGAVQPLRAGCSADDGTIGAVDVRDRVQVLLALSGDEGACYKITVTRPGQTLTGYVDGEDLPAIAAFVRDRERVSQAVSQAQSRTARAPAPTDTPAPPPLASLGRFEDFDEPSSAGNYVRLSAVQGRATVVTFWSPRSTRSRDQLLPVLPLYQTLKGKGLAVVGVSMDPDTDRIKEALDDITLPWPQVADHSGLARRYHVDAKAGEVFVLDASRNIVAAGPMGANIVNAVRQLLKAQ